LLRRPRVRRSLRSGSTDRTLDEIQGDGKQVFSTRHLTPSTNGKVLTIQIKESSGDRVVVYEHR
jgi:hypothetical protein